MKKNDVAAEIAKKFPVPRLDMTCLICGNDFDKRHNGPRACVLECDYVDSEPYDMCRMNTVQNEARGCSHGQSSAAVNLHTHPHTHTPTYTHAALWEVSCSAHKQVWDAERRSNTAANTLADICKGLTGESETTPRRVVKPICSWKRSKNK